MARNTRLNLPPLGARSDGTVVAGQLEHFARTLREWGHQIGAALDVSDSRLAALETPPPFENGTDLLDEQVGAGTTAINFLNIPPDFTHLRISGQTKHNNASGANFNRAFGVRFNGDTGANYSFLRISDTSAGTSRANADAVGIGQLAVVGDNFLGILELFIPNYTVGGPIHRAQAAGLAASTSNNSFDWTMFRGTASHLNSAPITRVDLVISGGGGDVFDASTRLSLYGLA